jgi:hypothetical protein
LYHNAQYKKQSFMMSGMLDNEVVVQY